MTRRTTLPAALATLGIVLLVAPALFPVQPVLYHDTSQSTTDNASQLREQDYRVVSYENLSARGRTLYVETLEADGRYFVPMGQGAADFDYPRLGQLSGEDDYREEQRLRRVVIERPEDDTHLPPADERLYRAEYLAENERRESSPNRTQEEFRRQIARYDVMETRTDSPPLTATASLARLLSAVLGVLAVGSGGYLRMQP